MQPTPPLRRLWPWLFPVTYAAHLTEEWVFGFPAWLNRVAGAGLADADFVAINTAGFVLMTAAAAFASVNDRAIPLTTALGALVLTNALVHAGACVVTASYSPGVVTAVLLWAPLGAYALARTRRDLGRAAFWIAVAAGILAHAAVSAAAITA